MRTSTRLNIFPKSHNSQILARNETALVNAHSIPVLSNLPRQEFFFDWDIFCYQFISAGLYFLYFIIRKQFIMGYIKAGLVKGFCRTCLVDMGPQNLSCAKIEQVNTAMVLHKLLSPCKINFAD